MKGLNTILLTLIAGAVWASAYINFTQKSKAEQDAETAVKVALAAQSQTQDLATELRRYKVADRKLARFILNVIAPESRSEWESLLKD